MHILPALVFLFLAHAVLAQQPTPILPDPKLTPGDTFDVTAEEICCEMWAGNTADLKTLTPIVKRMRERFRLREITVVADRGMVSQATLEAFEKSDPPVRYILGVRMRRQKQVNTSVLGSRARWFESVPERSHAKRLGGTIRKVQSFGF
jgi:hypothetical protein